MPVLMRGGGGGKKIKDATAVPSDVAVGKVFYNNDGRQVGNNSNPWMDLKSIEITLPNYGTSGGIALPNHIGNNSCTMAYSDDSWYPTKDYYYGPNLFQKKIALKGTIKFIERLKTTKKYYVYFKEFTSPDGGGLMLRNTHGNTSIVLYSDAQYLYILNMYPEFDGEKFKIWYR